MATLDEELELLSSMYDAEELRVERGAAGLRLTYRAVPSGAEAHDLRTVAVLELCADARYPASPVAIGIPIVRGLTEPQIAVLTGQLRRITADGAAAGEGCLFPLVSTFAEELRAAAGAAPCVVCYCTLEDLGETLTLPRCLHSFHDEECLVPWWRVRVAAHEASPAVLVRRRAAETAASAAAAPLAHATEAAEAAAARVAALQARVAAARATLDAAEHALATARASAAAGGKGGHGHGHGQAAKHGASGHGHHHGGGAAAAAAGGGGEAEPSADVCFDG